MHSKLRSWRSKHQPFNQLHPSLNVKLAAAGDRLSTPAPVMLLISRLHPVTDFRTILPWREIGLQGIASALSGGKFMLTAASPLPSRRPPHSGCQRLLSRRFGLRPTRHKDQKNLHNFRGHYPGQKQPLAAAHLFKPRSSAFRTIHAWRKRLPHFACQRQCGICKALQQWFFSGHSHSTVRGRDGMNT